nr:serine/threonine-protein kinase AfsK-like isoform X2 [Delphinus delphis]
MDRRSVREDVNSIRIHNGRTEMGMPGARFSRDHVSRGHGAPMHTPPALLPPSSSSRGLPALPARPGRLPPPRLPRAAAFGDVLLPGNAVPRTPGHRRRRPATLPAAARALEPRRGQAGRRPTALPEAVCTHPTLHPAALHLFSLTPRRWKDNLACPFLHICVLDSAFQGLLA